MIPQIVHYCWFGKSDFPELAKECVASWRRFMPDWEYKLWNEDVFDVNSHPYTKEAYEAGKYAFVSDYVRLWALCHEGGLYLDVDFMVYKSFGDLLQWSAFGGFEGSKHLPMMMGVCASEAHGEWVTEMLQAYDDRHFMVNGIPDLTTNVQFVTAIMATNGFRQDGTRQDYRDLHVFPVDYFCPRQTTGEYFRTENTYCEHLGMNSWAGKRRCWKDMVGKLVGQKTMTKLIKVKRILFG